MKMSYEKLFELLKQKNMSKTELKVKANISSATLAKLSKDETLSVKVIEKICTALQCQPGDMMKMVFERQTPLLKRLREEKAMQMKGGIYHKVQVIMAYNSNHIEGSALTEDQTRYIYETNTIGMESGGVANVDDIIETINHFKGLDYMIDCADQVLTEEIIKKFHAILKTNTSDSKKVWFNVGDYKLRMNEVGGAQTTEPEEVKWEIRKLLERYNDKEEVTFSDIVNFHYAFEKIHPFQDGNGRVGRLLMFKECLRSGITPFVIEEKNKMFYYRGLKEYKKEPGYLEETCLAAQDVFKEWMQYFEIAEG